MFKSHSSGGLNMIRTPRLSVLLLIVTALAFPPPMVFGQSDAFVGTWVLDRSKSDFNPPQPFQRRTLTVQANANGMTYTTRTVSDRLQATVTRFTVAEFG